MIFSLAEWATVRPSITEPFFLPLDMEPNTPQNSSTRT